MTNALVLWRDMVFRSWRLCVLLKALLSAVLMLLAFAPGAQGQGQPDSQGRPVDREPETGALYASGELIITFKSGSSTSSGEGAARGRGGRVKNEIPSTNAKTFSFPAVKNRQAQDVRRKALEQIKRALESTPLIEAVDYNY